MVATMRIEALVILDDVYCKQTELLANMDPSEKSYGELWDQRMEVLHNIAKLLEKETGLNTKEAMHLYKHDKKRFKNILK